ncbi:hypothetical protein TWF191_005137 [Orbilia oligospora]|uniref:Uncharacterized protein n=1 Tax=Orbilia oligospora TaxID=2813651 RepID=A0A7C8QVB3_ORBOL|nr:hypothetical protein TWF191_005137 [Orbilia oligospora]
MNGLSDLMYSNGRRNRGAIYYTPINVNAHTTKANNVLIRIMGLLNLHDLSSLASTNRSTRKILELYPEHVVVPSLKKTLPKTEILKWFPFPGTSVNSEPAFEVTVDHELTSAEQKGLGTSSSGPTDPYSTVHHLVYLRHANRVWRVFDGIFFFSKWLHRVERHGNNGNHDCSTEYHKSKICNETFRVVLFLAQNEVYSLHRYLRHCTVEERIAVRCHPQAFDKVELPLPENWWIKGRVLWAHRGKLKEIEAESPHGKEHSRQYLDHMLAVDRDASFQHRRMWLAKYLTKEANITPARKIEEFEKRAKEFWYSKGIVAGLVFTQIAPLSWWHDSMVMGAWQSKDRDIRGFEHMRDVSISCYQRAVKVVDTLAIKH